MSTRRSLPKDSVCGCSESTNCGAPATTEQEASVAQAPRLEDLIPIAVVVAGGCEKCAQRMVARALSNGASPRQIRKTLAIVALFQKQDCFAEEVGRDAIARMSGPLAMGRRTLEILSAATG